MDRSHPAPEGSRAGPLPEPPESVAVPEQVAEEAERPSRGLVSMFRIDVAPLRRSKEFRLLFVGQAVSFFGSMVTYVALPYQAYRISHSSLIVGLLSLTELIPLLITAFVGGALADSVDRRRMVRLTESAMCLVVGALVVNSLSAQPRLSVLFVVAFAAAGIDGLQRPSLEAMVSRLVSAEELPAASALSSLKGNLGMVAGPPVAGVLIVAVGLPVTYGLDVGTFLVSLAALALMRAVPPPPESDGLSLRAIADGLRYARSRQDLLGSYLVDVNAMFFGIPTALFPQVASHFGGAAVLGVLYAAPSAGSLLVTLTSGWTRHVRRHGRAVALAAGLWGLGIVGFGFASSLPLAIVGLVVAGGADMVSGLFRTTMWNQSIPDLLRGRLAGIEMLSYSSGPTLGNVEAGLVEALAGLRASIVSGGVLCVVGTAALVAALPRFWNYDAAAGARLRAMPGK
ncbi:MAG: MFS transporter [Acidimicrobiales bacterium]|jgi:MFS family permease